MIREALSDAIGVFVLIHFLTINQGVVLQSTIGVGIDQEVAHNGSAGDALVIFLARKNGRLAIPPFDLVQVHAAINQHLGLAKAAMKKYEK